jgi:long-subunit fatty acid transport protein
VRVVAVLLVACPSVARAAALDQLEIGGPWGTPTATDATAVWWDPAGLAMGEHTRIMVEAAPVTAKIAFDRTDPDGGLDEYGRKAVIPFAGVATDLGIDDFGMGVGLVVPFAKGAEELDPPGSGSFAMRAGSIQAAHLILAVAARPHPTLAIGGFVAMVASEWSTELDSETLTSLHDNLVAEGQDPGYTDDLYESEEYRNVANLGPLEDTGFTGGIGIHLRPSDSIDAAITFVKGLEVVATGDGHFDTGCPPESDVIGRFALESQGLCDVPLDVHASATYTLPSRIQGGIATTIGKTRLEAMGGWVGWSVYRDLVVDITDTAALNPSLSDEAGEAFDVSKVRARDAEDTFWVGIDGKVHFGPTTTGQPFTAGARATFDRHAIPDTVLGPNHFDADTLLLSGLVAYRITPAFELGLSATHWFVARRVVTDSAFELHVDEAERPADPRYWYAPMNGTYDVSVNRFGIQGRIAF